MKKLLFVLTGILFALQMAGCSSGGTDVSGGGGTETVLGVLYTESGVAAGVTVSIMPIGASPFDSVQGGIQYDTTDNRGCFSFSVADSGTYALSAAENGRGFIKTVLVGDSTLPVVDTMRLLGSVSVRLPSNADYTSGYLYVKGVPRVYELSTFSSQGGFAQLDSMPADETLRIVYGTDGGVDHAVTSVTVISGDTVTAFIDSSSSKPLWYFPVYALVSPATLAACGGSIDSATHLIAVQLDSVNLRFNRSNLFNGTFQYKLEKVDTLTTSLDNAMLSDPPAGYAVKLVYHASPSESVPGIIETYYRSLLVNYCGGAVFSPTALNYLVHYLSRLRGALALDIFILSENAVGGPLFTPPVSVLSQPDSGVWDSVGASSWDAYSAGVINAYASSWYSGYSDYEYCNTTMKALRVHVVNAAGSPVSSASITVYGQDWLSSAINTTPVRTAMTTGVDGSALFDPSPFDVRASGSPVRSGVLVRVLSPDYADTAWSFISFVNAAGQVFDGAAEVEMTAAFSNYSGN